MALKLTDSVQRVAHHVNDGPVEMYAVDARLAVANHPDEWSHEPWDPQEAAAARQRLHQRRVAAAQAAGRDPPPEPAEPELTEEERKLIAEHRERVAAAKKVLAEEEAEEAAKRDHDAKIAEAKAVVTSPGPQIAPRKPGRPSNAERAAAAKPADKTT